jgi:hypothetical protein
VAVGVYGEGDEMTIYGPNVARLIIKFIARGAIPSGGGLADGLEFFSNREKRQQVLALAETKALESIQSIKSAPDNPYGNNDEDIARVLLEKIEERKQLGPNDV